jgi:CDP-diglyceride synthetase
MRDAHMKRKDSNEGRGGGLDKINCLVVQVSYLRYVTNIIIAFAD